jgi:hypothetical protein
MKRKILLAIFSVALFSSADAQKKKGQTTAYAITGMEKGNRGWTEVKLIDIATGEVISPVYESKSEVKRLNARTGKPIVIPEGSNESSAVFIKNADGITRTKEGKGEVIIIESQRMPNAAPTTNGTHTQLKSERRMVITRSRIKREEPFATSSAACAYDKKHDRLYYTPMGINELRYIDLKSKSPSVLYFENEAFGKVKGMGDADNQITRMVIASDGNGYALNNSADQLLQFTTKKRPVITDLGPVTDDASNGKFSIRNRHAYGGDMVADDAGNLYLITANRRVYRIDIETRVAKYLGSIKGLPEHFTTNGAIVEKDNAIIVTSSTSTMGYYRFTLDNMQAELVSAGSPVFNASDLANANLLSYKKKKDEKQEDIVRQEPVTNEDVINKAAERSIRTELTRQPAISVYPNPVTSYSTRISLSDYPEGRYELQLVDLAGRQIKKESVQVNGRSQVVDFRLPNQLAKGSYFLRVINSANIDMNVEKLIVQ